MAYIQYNEHIRTQGMTIQRELSLKATASWTYFSTSNMLTYLRAQLEKTEASLSQLQQRAGAHTNLQKKVADLEALTSDMKRQVCPSRFPYTPVH